MENNYKFFKNFNCEYYPCHNNIEEINCLFCYCPLYFIKKCEGNYTLNNNGQKDCSNCIKPHIPNKGYKHIQKILRKYNKLNNHKDL